MLSQLSITGSLKMPKHIEDVLLETFPKLYYAAPVMEKHLINASGGNVPCSEYGDAILWILGVLSRDERDSYEQGEIEDIFCRKYDITPPSTTFRTRMKTFRAANLIGMIDDEYDERKWRVMLTDEGREKLNAIRKQRLSLLRPIISLLEKAPAEECQLVLKYIHDIGEKFWESAKAESFTRAREIQRKKRNEKRLPARGL